VDGRRDRQIAKGDRPGGEHIFIDPLDNPHIDIRKLLAMRSGMTEHDWQTQIRGRILALPDACSTRGIRSRTSDGRRTSATSRTTS
jgi:hypothetical protein